MQCHPSFRKYLNTPGCQVFADEMDVFLVPNNKSCLPPKLTELLASYIYADYYSLVP